MVLAAKYLGHTPKAIISPNIIKRNPYLHDIRSFWCESVGSCDIYVGKSDAFYLDKNWEIISNLDAFKVCMCSSDRCFRESDREFGSHKGTPVQTRCDLYMPVNHTAQLMDECGSMVYPVTHPIAPEMYRLLRYHGLYKAYISDNIKMIRKKYCIPEIGKAGFLGSNKPIQRQKDADALPNWVDIKWATDVPVQEYISWMMERRGCIDFRGFGDKSIRFTESALLGRTIITSPQISEYRPLLVHGENAIIIEWGAEIEYNEAGWRRISNNATYSYLNGWSILSQVRKFVEMAS
jgi:hypothetical protein